jgi:hypothetical protein
MSAHSLKSALLPKIEKILKMLTVNMHILDVYFVKYTESRIAAFQEALVSSEPSTPAAFPIDKFLSETRPTAGNMPTVQDLRSRVEAMPAVMTPPDTVLVKEKERTEPVEAEPPAIDLRTGIITVAQEEPKQAKPAAVPTKKTQVPAPKKKIVRPVPSADEVFDFEKEMSARSDHAAPPPFGPPGTFGSVDVVAPPPFGDVVAPDRKALHTEKTMKWDRDELKGLAAGKPESIVVEGTEQVKADTPKSLTSGAPKTAAPQPDAKNDDIMISGEDIENTLDSFFGLEDR